MQRRAASLAVCLSFHVLHVCMRTCLGISLWERNADLPLFHASNVGPYDGVVDGAAGALNGPCAQEPPSGQRHAAGPGCWSLYEGGREGRCGAHQPRLIVGTGALRAHCAAAAAAMPLRRRCGCSGAGRGIWCRGGARTQMQKRVSKLVDVRTKSESGRGPPGGIDRPPAACFPGPLT